MLKGNKEHAEQKDEVYDGDVEYGDRYVYARMLNR